MIEKDFCVVPAGSVTVKGRMRSWPSISTATLVPASKRSDWSCVFGVQPGRRAEMLACRRPAALGTTETPTLAPGPAVRVGLGDTTILAVGVGADDTGVLVG